MTVVSKSSSSHFFLNQFDVDDKLTVTAFAIGAIACAALALYAHFHRMAAWNTYLAGSFAATSGLGALGFTAYRISRPRTKSSPPPEEPVVALLQPGPRTVVICQGSPDAQASSALLQLPLGLIAFIFSFIQTRQDAANCMQTCKKLGALFHSKSSLPLIRRWLPLLSSEENDPWNALAIEWNKVSKSFSKLLIDTLGGIERIVALPPTDFFKNHTIDDKKYSTLLTPTTKDSIEKRKEKEQYRTTLFAKHSLLRGEDQLNHPFILVGYIVNGTYFRTFCITTDGNWGCSSPGLFVDGSFIPEDDEVLFTTLFQTNFAQKNGETYQLSPYTPSSLT